MDNQTGSLDVLRKNLLELQDYSGGQNNQSSDGRLKHNNLDYSSHTSETGSSTLSKKGSPTSGKRVDPGAASLSATGNNMFNPPPPPDIKYLGLCVRKTRYVQWLDEIDVSVVGSDSQVFSKIKENLKNYREATPRAQLFSLFFELTGAVFIKVKSRT